MHSGHSYDDGGDDKFEKISGDAKDKLGKDSNDGDDIFEKISDDAKDKLTIIEGY